MKVYIVIVFVATVDLLVYARAKSMDDTIQKKEIYQIQVQYNGNTALEQVELDTTDNIEIYENIPFNENAVDAILDFDRGLEAFVFHHKNECLIRPFDGKSILKPNDLKQYLESDKDTGSMEFTESEPEYWTISSNPLLKRDMVGNVINKRCGDREIYWLLPGACTLHGGRTARNAEVGLVETHSLYSDCCVIIIIIIR